ncbi:unnamed protein product [Acanthoscelides obtectus]|uniref:Uncharacterized protein n=1 Tax=Acanthoscelides obtectus TaxID=200917 RepID=A0A9P0KXH3_ACAOB|nr:unnamed protein product [Acanthoscelides obtectus]CAK1634480.1 hypothetical protein AOBTE_LOCUS8766 [Acanthoscelides obtectus]
MDTSTWQQHLWLLVIWSKLYRPTSQLYNITQISTAFVAIWVTF